LYDFIVETLIVVLVLQVRRNATVKVISENNPISVEWF